MNQTTEETVSSDNPRTSAAVSAGDCTGLHEPRPILHLGTFCDSSGLIKCIAWHVRRQKVTWAPYHRITTQLGLLGMMLRNCVTWIHQKRLAQKSLQSLPRKARMTSPWESPTHIPSHAINTLPDLDLDKSNQLSTTSTANNTSTDLITLADYCRRFRSGGVRT